MNTTDDLRISTSYSLCLQVHAARSGVEIERLVLGMPVELSGERSVIRPARCRCPQPLANDLNLLHASASGILPDRLTAPEKLDQRIYYRWIIGHHAAFGIWQLLADQLNEIYYCEAPSRASVSIAASLFDAYSVLFLYSGSCSAEQYADILRPQMVACDPAFSGEWSRDYKSIPRLFRAVRHAKPVELLKPLLCAVKMNHWIHQSVAAHLVPNGASLLRQSGRHPGLPASEAERSLFDAFFLVDRRQVCSRTRAAQLLRRLSQITCDLAAHELPPLTSVRSEDDHRVRALRCIEQDAAQILREVGDVLCAAEGGIRP